jgi:hypothetical protein
MTPRQLRSVLESVEDLGVFVLRAEDPAEPHGALLADWRAAADEARFAYDEWRRRRDRDSYAVYRARAEQADAAHDALAARLSR